MLLPGAAVLPVALHAEPLPRTARASGAIVSTRSGLGRNSVLVVREVRGKAEQTAVYMLEA